MVTDLHVTGKVAQFGRGVMADVSSKLLGQFVECLETTVLAAPAPSDAAPAPEAPAPTDVPVVAAPPAPEASTLATGPRKIDSPDAKPVDLVDAAGGSVAKRAAPVLVVIALLWLVRVLLKRRKK